MEILSIRLQEERKHCGLTQKQLAEKIGISWHTYRSYESLGNRHTNPSLETLVQLATILNTTTDYLLGKDHI